MKHGNWGWAFARGWRGVSAVLLVLMVGGLAVARAGAQEEAPAEIDGRLCGIVAYDWNGTVTTADRGFPREQPPRNNFNWQTSPNYAAGTIYYRAIIRSQPEPQAMRLQLCFWQPVSPTAEYQFGLENCGPQASVLGESGTTVEWQVDVANMWKKDDKDIDWARARYRTAVAVKNSIGQPVSDYNYWNWNGENASKWYPLDMRFTAVVVPPGGEFCGWDYYDNPSALALGSLRATSTGPQAAASLSVMSLVLVTVWALRRRSA